MAVDACLQIEEVKWKHTQQKIAHGIGGNNADGCDLSSNRVC